MALFYRIKQFYWSFKHSVSKEDICFINTYLNLDEKGFFFKLPVYEQNHCLRVAKDVHNEIIRGNKDNEYINSLVKAGLLHDIGKVSYKINPFTKGILVIGDKISNAKMKKLCFIKSVYIYYNHGEDGYQLMRPLEQDELILFIIKNHHNYLENSEELNLVRTCDNRN